MAGTQLSSIKEILEATEVLGSENSAKVVRVGQGFAVKYGADVSLLEADTMRYVSANSDTPVPKVFGTITDPDDLGVNYIIMEFIERQRLDAIWPDLITSEQEDMKSQLKAGANSMRLMPHPGFIGSIGRQKCTDGVFYTCKAHDPEVNGPFATEADMNEGILRRVAETRPASTIRPFRTILSNMLTHRIVFTHADLQARNFIVNRTRADIDGPSKLKLTIIDWEMSGWYPEYWEFCNSILFNAFHAEWLDIIQDIMVVYTNKYLLMQKIRNILF
jgi:aminoglycoside phosphotransferase (APT) family kinase protein